jgi:hypothetical protein
VESKPSLFCAQVHGLASSTELNDEMGHIVGASQTVRPAPNPVPTGRATSLTPYRLDAPRPSPRTDWMRRVPHPVPTGRAASLTPYRLDAPRPSPRTIWTRCLRVELPGSHHVRAVAVTAGGRPPPAPDPLNVFRPTHFANRCGFWSRPDLYQDPRRVIVEIRFGRK